MIDNHFVEVYVSNYKFIVKTFLIKRGGGTGPLKPQQQTAKVLC